MTTTDTRAALDAAIDKFARAAIDDANALGAPDEFAAAKAAWAAIAPAITAHVEAEVTRRLTAAPVVEEALAAYGAAVYELGYVLHRPDRDAVLRPIKDAAEAALRAAIAADRERAIRDHNATWQAHDLERDAEVARWQGEAHTLVRAVKSIAAAVGAPDVPSGDGWAERAVAAVIGKATRPTPDEARRLVAELREAAADVGSSGAHSASGPDEEAIRAEAAAESALLRALGVEA